MGSPPGPHRPAADFSRSRASAYRPSNAATNREIAVRLALSPRTIDHHLRGVFTRLGIRSRIELVRLLAESDEPESESG
ncbi:helix-turn-helix transcriptional regulator [Streptomyces sp. WAC 01325]|uniref:helix-turn-helix transcriptional regulator n=1 Tax=Streptomyces sp. WAC 01325 TaxID=2203202 RepID=UPI0037DA55C9